MINWHTQIQKLSSSQNIVWAVIVYLQWGWADGQPYSHSTGHKQPLLAVLIFADEAARSLDSCSWRIRPPEWLHIPIDVTTYCGFKFFRLSATVVLWDLMALLQNPWKHACVFSHLLYLKVRHTTLHPNLCIPPILSSPKTLNKPCYNISPLLQYLCSMQRLLPKKAFYYVPFLQPLSSMLPQPPGHRPTANSAFARPIFMMVMPPLSQMSLDRFCT